MELLDYNCGWESISIHRKDDEGFLGEETITTTFDHPYQMYNSVLQQWEQYCPAEANSAFLMNIGEDVHWIAQTIEDNTKCQVDFFRKEADKAFLMVRFNIKEE